MMIEFLKNIDREILLFFNGIGANEVTDVMMWNISAHWFWVPVMLTALYYIIKDYKKKAWIPIIFVIICFTLTDQGSTQFKYFFERYRPSHNLELQGLLHHVNNYKGGLYGFFSGHAASSFGLFAITSYFIKRKHYTYIVLFWAIIVSYSRIYLGVHYPSDSVVGLIWGLSSAFVLFSIYKKFILPRIDPQNFEQS